MNWSELSKDLRERIIKTDPTNFNQSGIVVARLEDPQRKPNQRSQSEDRKLDEVPQSVARRVTIISFRKRLVDAHDNLRTGAKPLVDAITADLGFSHDADPRLTWEYHQLKTDGAEGTLVKIERI